MINLVRLVTRALRRAALPMPASHAASGLVAVFWTGAVGSMRWPHWPQPGGHTHWVGVFDRADNRCLVVARLEQKSGLVGERFRAACAADVAALGYRPASDGFSPVGPWGAWAFEVTATPAAGLPGDISAMAFRPAPVELPAFA